MRVTLLHAFTAILLWAYAPLNAAPITIDLEGENTRHAMSISSLEQKVELCQMEPGNSYLLRVLTQSGPEVLIQSEEGLSSHFLMTAEADCGKITLQKSEQSRALSEIVLSVSCMTCTPEFDNRAPNLTVQGGFSALELIQDIFIGGDCFEIQNAAVVGNPQGIGAFSNGGTSIGIDNGVILSSGNINTAPGPNNQGGAGTNTGGGSHPDLAQLASAQVFDATGITFQFKPTVPQIFFNYAFASEEYCEYVGAGFNDVFGFFISGPGINGGFLLSGENIAVIPGTNTAVAIDEVNHINNTAFFVGNSNTCNSTFNMSDIQFDGFTQVLTAVANVQPCETYFIRLLVGDAGDGIFDSAVFLEANSFNAGGAEAGEAVSPSTGSNITYEACSDGYFVLTAAGDINTNRDIEFTIAPFSTATLGVDYAPFPTTVTVPAGQTEVVVPITVFPDAIIEGQETIVLELQNSCSCSGTYIELIIEDVPPLEAEVFDIELCDGLPGQLDALVFGGLPGYNYTWSTGDSGPTLGVSPTETTVYGLTVTDGCSQVATSTAVVTVNPAAGALMVGGGQFCGTDFEADIQVTFDGIGPWLFNYSIDGEFQEPILVEESPYIIEATEPGFYFPESVISTQSLCEGTVQGLAFIEVSEFEIEANGQDISCNGENDGSISATAMNGVTPYSYSWENVLADTSVGGNTPMIENLGAGTYSVTVNDNDGCADSIVVEIIEPEALAADASVASVPNCTDGNGGSIDLALTGGTQGFTFQWSNADTVQNPTGLVAGDYSVTVTDGGGCEAIAQATVIEDTEPPIAIAAVEDTITCYDPEISLSGNGSSEGSTYLASWAGPGLVSGGTTLNPSVGQEGMYVLTVTNTDNGCVSLDTVEVAADLTAPIAAAEEDVLNCYQPQFQADASGSSMGSEYTYQWSGPGIAGSETVIDPLLYAPGDYTLVVTNTINGCTDDITITITENKADPVVDAGEPAELNCDDTEIILSGSASGNQADFVYAWSTNTGNIISGGNTLNPMVDAEGTYELLVTDTLNGCTATSQVEIIQDPSLPVALVSGAATLNCMVEDIQLDATNSNLGTNGVFNWVTQDGNFASGENTLSPTIDAPGTYQLIILGGGNVCEDTATVIIPIDTLRPDITPPATDRLTCDITELELTAQVSTVSGQTDINWFGPAGLSIISPDSLTISAVNPGNYLLAVIDPVSGCTRTVSTEITQDVELPTLAIEPPATITCSASTVDIDASASSSGADFVYQWGAPDGSMLTEASAVLGGVNTPGTYSLQIENTDNGCVDSMTVDVEENINYPTVDIEPAEILNCVNTSFNLQSMAASNGAALLYNWTTAGGNLVSGSDSADPIIDAPGQYTLAVTDASNDCVTTASVEVTQDIEAPNVDAGTGEELTCSLTEFTLSGAASGNGQLDLNWTTTDGNIVSGANSLTPTVNSAGSYLLEVTDQSNGCTSTSEVEMTADAEIPVTLIASPELLDCENNEVALDASNSDNGTNFVYEWTTSDGSITGSTSSQQALTSAAGTYTLQITNTDNDCVNTATVTVIEDREQPTAEAGSLDTLNCYSPSLQLDGNASSQGVEYSYQWTTPNGNLISGADGLSPMVDAPGMYELQVTNTVNNCVDTDMVNIEEDFEEPAASAAEPAVLTCSLLQTNLNGNGSSQGSVFSYQWTTQNGNLVNGSNALTPTVDEPGTYQLEVLNNRNGCTSITTVEVQEDVALPTAEAGASPTLTCAVTSIALDGSGSSQGNFAYEWGGPGIQSNSDGTAPVVNMPGNYIITVTNLDNDCVSEDMVEVLQDITPPVAAIATPDVLNCAVESLELDGSGSSQGSIYTFDWSADVNGNIVQDGQTSSPVIDQPGEYTLLVTNTDNGCTESESIVVDQDVEVPVISAANPDIITCSVPEITIDGSGSSTGGMFDYQWSTTTGNILEGSNTLMPIVNEGGAYQLLITNTVNFCTSQLTVDVEKDVAIPVAEAGESQILNCTIESLSLDGTSSSTGDFSYEWTGPGLLSGAATLSPQVNEPGTYVILVSNNFNGCTSEDEVLIEQDIAQPVAQIASPAVLNCELESQSLDGTATNQGSIFVYEWTTSGTGNIMSGATTLTPEINGPGVYVLNVLNTENGCTDTEQVAVEQDITIPEVGAAEPDIITCVVPEIQIDATSSSSGDDYVYQWSTQDGNILSGSNSLSPMVNEGGSYQLLIVNSLNQCTNLLTVEVEKDIEQPIAEAGSTQELNCDIPTVTLDGTGSSTGDFSYAWEGPGLQDVSTITTNTGDPGTYTIFVTNNFNGCVSSDQVIITQDIAVPVINIQTPDVLTCALDAFELDATSSSQGATLIYQWTSPNGNILEGGDGLTPLIDQPGQYTLTIINTANQCENDGAISVAQDITEPTAFAGQDYLMDCWEDTDELSGVGSSEGPIYTYQWSAQGGTLVSGSTTLQPVINSPGIYTLEVTNLSNGCVDEDEVIVTQTIPVASVDAIQPPCYGDPGHIYIPGVEAGTPPYVYSIDGGNDFFSGSNFTNLSPGNYEVVVQDVNGCEYESAISIVQPDSMVVLLTVDETELSFGETHQIVTQVNLADEEIADIVWSNTETLSCDDCLTPIASPFYSTDYRVDVTSINGCHDEAFLRIYVNRERNVYVPNVFSPNADGANDRFYIFAKDGTVAKVKSFNIFNRWGETVFEVYNFQPNDPTFGWDGFFRGELMNGAVFAWYAEIEFIDGTVELFEGDVLLFR
jgi:gliding motility-associated-like protein